MYYYIFIDIFYVCVGVNLINLHPLRNFQFWTNRKNIIWVHIFGFNVANIVKRVEKTKYPEIKLVSNNRIGIFFGRTKYDFVL